ncbi:MAG: Blp family class II bacteriocin [Defluviitaleaceae bacterium]|nr:Blp family class II bacteriocin [Defluviitaleaceae bacterium]
MNATLKLNGFEELNQNELLTIEGGNRNEWCNFANAFVGTLIIAAAPIAAVVGGVKGSALGPVGTVAGAVLGASTAVGIGADMLSNIRF